MSEKFEQIIAIGELIHLGFKLLLDVISIIKEFRNGKSEKKLTNVYLIIRLEVQYCMLLKITNE